MLGCLYIHSSHTLINPAHKFRLSVSAGGGRKALEAVMLTGCFVWEPLRGFDSPVFENIFQDVSRHNAVRGMMLEERG